MQKSPYTPGETAEQVPGRERQLAEYEQQMTLLADTQQLIGRIRVEHAPRGLGKTSLLRQVKQRADSRGLLTVWVTAGEGNGLLAEISAGIRRETSAWSKEGLRSIGKTLDSVNVAFGVPGVAKVDARFKGPDDPGAARVLQNLISTTAWHALREGKRGLIIFIDEFQLGDPAGIRAVAYAWQHLQSEEPSLPAAIFAAGLPGTPIAIGRVVTFSERFAYRALPPLDGDAERIAIVAPASVREVRWEEAAVEAAKEMARGYPYKLQLVADAAWTAAGYPDPGGTITVADVLAGKAAVDEDMDVLFRNRWASATPGERDFLQAMAEVGGDGPVHRVDIVAALSKKKSSDVSMVRASLLEKGLIEAGERGYVEFTLPGFAEFIISTTEDDI